MVTADAAQSLADACLKLVDHAPHQALEWLVDDVLADFGIRPAHPPPKDMHDWLFEHAGQYARAVFAHPFEDVLGQAYEAIASRGRREQLGQFFTPVPIAQLMGAMLCGSNVAHARAREDGQLWSVCEPTCGSGALLLGFLGNLAQDHGPGALRYWSVTGIDLDSLCARMCAGQVLTNVHIHGTHGEQGHCGLGELVVYCGNSLGPSERLKVVVHATRPNLRADVVLPALHPARVAMVRQAERQYEAPAGLSMAGTAEAAQRTRKANHADRSPWRNHQHGHVAASSHPLDDSTSASTLPAVKGQVDLFGD